MPIEPLLTKAEARERLHVSRATLDRLIKDGALPVVRLDGRGERPMIRIRPEALDDYLTRGAA